MLDFVAKYVSIRKKITWSESKYNNYVTGCWITTDAVPGMWSSYLCEQLYWLFIAGEPKDIVVNVFRLPI